MNRPNPKTLVLSEDDKKFIAAARELLEDEKVLLMQHFIQHGKVSCYDHCLMVALYSYLYAKHLKIKVNVEALVRGAMLHDFFLYDWHKTAFTPDGLHGFSHPYTALKNACRFFNLTERERNIIYCHMWPLTPLQIPAYPEAWLVCLADKYCSLKETLLKDPYDK